MISWHEVLLRLMAALLFCGGVGLERYLAGKAAGLRTHVLVGMGAALFTLISGYAFGTTASNADRIAAQVVSGIGFIGGGAILRDRGEIHGLTTAAGLWAVAALGMAAGAGLFTIGGMGTALILLTLVVLRAVEVHVPRRIVNTWSIQVTLGQTATIASMRGHLESECRSLTLEGLISDTTTQLYFVAEFPHNYDIDALDARMRAAGATSITWRAYESAGMDRGA